MVKCGFPIADVRAVATWEGDGECTLRGADALRDFQLCLIDMRAMRRIVTLEGIFAARIYCVLDPKARIRTNDSFNCFMAVDAALHGRIPARYANAREEKGTLQPKERLPFAEAPHGFQLRGEYDAFDEQDEPVRVSGIIHEGIVLAHDTDGQPIVFQKNGATKPHVTRWQNVIETYAWADAACVFDLPRS